MVLEFLMNNWWVFGLLAFLCIGVGAFLQLRNMSKVNALSMQETIVWQFGPVVIAVLAGLLNLAAGIIGLITVIIQKEK
jgi:hypothetical protein